MDYEKKYNHALEVVRELQKDWASTQNRAAREIESAFPELRESEDERMMREFNDYLCEEIECRTNDVRDEKDRRTLIMLTKVKDWLEKQKEQKPVDYPHIPGWEKNNNGNKPKLKQSVLMLTTHGVAEGEWLGEKWCQYRWSCELKDSEVLYWMHMSDLARLEKEDERQEQKPAWSEEDEKIKSCIGLALTDVDEQRFKDFGTTLKDCLAWLKSLCPQWKPSDQ